MVAAGQTRKWPLWQRRGASGRPRRVCGELAKPAQLFLLMVVCVSGQTRPSASLWSESVISVVSFCIVLGPTLRVPLCVAALKRIRRVHAVVCTAAEHTIPSALSRSWGLWRSQCMAAPHVESACALSALSSDREVNHGRLWSCLISDGCCCCCCCAVAAPADRPPGQYLPRLFADDQWARCCCVGVH